MPLYGPSTSTATVAANTNVVTITGMDLNAVIQQGMTINFGARDRAVGDAWIINTVVPNGTNGGTLTTAGSIPTAYNSVPFLIDARGFNGTDASYAAAVSLKLLQSLSNLLGPATNLFAGARQLVFDKVATTALGRLAFATAGRTWGDIAHRAFNFTPTGGAAGTIETIGVRAYPDGATPVDALLINLNNGTGDLRKGVTVMASGLTVDLGSAPAGKVYVTGATTINSFGSGRNLDRIVLFTDGAATLVHGPALILPGLANILTRGGDMLHAVSDADGNWRVLSYQRLDGRPVVHKLIVSGNSGSAAIPTGETRYLVHGLVGGHQSNVYIAAGRRGRFSNLRCVGPSAPGDGQSWKFTLQKLFTDTALSCTIAGTTTNQAADTVNSVIFEASDRWCIKAVSSPGASGTNCILFSMDFEVLD